MNIYSNFKFTNAEDNKCVKVFNNEFVTVSQITHENGNENMRCILSGTRVAWLVFSTNGTEGYLVDLYVTEGVGEKRKIVENVNNITPHLQKEALNLYQLYKSNKKSNYGSY